MQPVSFEEVQCPVTKTRERRRMVQTGLDCSSPGPTQRSRDLPACGLLSWAREENPHRLGGCQNEVAAVLWCRPT
jgi:hypothetical protein